jgi:hypothetical protein
LTFSLFFSFALYSFITKFLKLFSTGFFLSFTTILKLFDFDTDILLLLSLLYILFILFILLLLLLLLLLNEEKKVVLILIDDVPPISLDISDPKDQAQSCDDRGEHTDTEGYLQECFSLDPCQSSNEYHD